MAEAASLPVIFVGADAVASAGLDPAQLAWAIANDFTGQRGRLLALPDASGALSGYLFGTGPETERPALVAGLAGAGLGEGRFALAGDYGDPTLAALGFRLGAYRFGRYRDAKPAPELDLPDAADAGEV
ncbi:MAG TPA: leucyl aminopeptidase family protein, partial [Devosia sp.]|nr:leucyl aminopeptidase family protein [Devosia sp.]